MARTGVIGCHAAPQQALCADDALAIIGGVLFALSLLAFRGRVS
jgi:hypothetical protein